MHHNLSSLEIQTYAMNTGKTNCKHAHCYTYYKLVSSSLDYGGTKIKAILKIIQKSLESITLNLNHFFVESRCKFLWISFKGRKDGQNPPLE